MNVTSSRAGSALVPAIGIPAGVMVVGSAGLVAGLRGPGIMSGLARCGSVIGAGAVGGLLVLGVLVGGATLVAMSPELRDDRFLPDGERAARKARRVGSAVGLAAGSAGTVITVSALGTPGFSAAGITSGLAALGAVFGGGMKAGTKCAIAIPALAAILGGYITWKLYLRHMESDETEDRSPFPRGLTGP